MAIRAEDVDKGEEVDLDRDRALVVRYQQGDDAAFDELYRRYFARLHRYCTRRVGDEHVAEELAQEAFLRALRAMPGFAGERRFYPWMTVIAQRLCIDHHRTSARVEPSSDIDMGSVEADHGDVFAAVDRSHLAVALDRVAPRHRDVLHLREQEGWSYQQIATHLEVPITTVEALLHRARKALRREFLAVSGAGRLSSIPVIGGIAAVLGRLRSRLGSTASAASHGPAQLAAAGLAAASLLAAPLVLGTRSPSPGATSTRATTPAATVIDAPAPAAPVAAQIAPVAVAAPAAATGGAADPASPDTPGAEVGPVVVYTTPDGADHAGDQAAQMPLNLIVAPRYRAGADATVVLDPYLTSLEATK